MHFVSERRHILDTSVLPYFSIMSSPRSGSKKLLGTLSDGSHVTAPRIEKSEITYSSSHPQGCKSWDPALQYCHGCRATCRGKQVWVKHFVTAHDDEQRYLAHLDEVGFVDRFVFLHLTCVYLLVYNRGRHSITFNSPERCAHDGRVRREQPLGDRH